MKCDEIKPYCKQCTESGRICDGYSSEQSRRSSTDGSASGNSRNADRALEVAKSSVSPRLDIHINEYDYMRSEECRCFYIFHLQTTSQLGGSNDTEFWTRLVLQAA